MRPMHVTDTELANIKFVYKDKYKSEMKLSNHDARNVYSEYRGTGPSVESEDEWILDEIREQEKELGLI